MFANVSQQVCYFGRAVVPVAAALILDPRNREQVGPIPGIQVRTIDRGSLSCDRTASQEGQDKEWGSKASHEFRRIPFRWRCEDFGGTSNFRYDVRILEGVPDLKKRSG